MRMKEVSVEEQIQQILLYMQGISADIWKKNIIEDLEREFLNYKIVEKFLADLKEEFGRGDNEIMKVGELKKVEQGSRTIEEFVQKFRRAVRGSEYKERLLVEEFKREMNGVIR